jgi:hypothetical protein
MSIGGNCLQVSLDKCYSRMKVYTALVADVVATEFPDYELFGAFGVFDVTSLGRALHENVVSDDASASLERLAQAFGVQLAALRDQWLRVRHMAHREYVTLPGICNKAAWQLAVRSVQHHGATKLRWNMDALLPVLWRFVGWTAATSGVEQNFSKALRAIGPNRGSLTAAHEEMMVRFAVYKPSAQESEDLIVKARAIWSKHYGAPRQISKNRCDKGVPRPRDSMTPTTEADWLRKRRNAAKEAGRRLGDLKALTIEGAMQDPGWTAGHDDEHTFQVKKRAKKELQALEDGLLLQREIRDDMEEALIKTKQANRKADRDAKRKFNARSAKANALQLKAGSQVWMETDDDAVQRAVLSKGCRIASELSVHIHVLVVADPTQLSKQQRWIAVLTGALVCSVESVCAATGPFIRYAAAIATRKRLFMSQDFQGKRSTITALIKEASNLHNSEWRVCQNAPHDGAKCVKLGGHHGMKAKSFLKSITKIRRKESR